MKNSAIALLNSLGFVNASQKAAYAAHLLKAATVSSPEVTITPAVPAVPPRAEVIAQTAKPIRAASGPVAGAANTTGYTFGQLYLNSPAYPAGTAIPAIPVKPASLAVVGVPAVVGSPLVPAVVAPAIAATPGWSDAIEITKAASSFKIVAYLPYKSSPALIGAPTGLVGGINEITPAALQVTAWLDTKASNTPGTETTEPLTLEQYFYKQALAIVSAPGSTSTIENATRTVNNAVVACKKITLNIAASNYTLGTEALQLGKLG